LREGSKEFEGRKEFGGRIKAGILKEGRKESEGRKGREHLCRWMKPAKSSCRYWKTLTVCVGGGDCWWQ
jgi:hypothetical protein